MKKILVRVFIAILILSPILIFIELVDYNTWKRQIFDLTGQKIWVKTEFELTEYSITGRDHFSIQIAKLDKDQIGKILDSDLNTNSYSLIWNSTPTSLSETEIVEFVIPNYVHWDDFEKQRVNQIRQILSEKGSYYSYRKVDEQNVSFYILSDKYKMVVIIQHDLSAKPCPIRYLQVKINNYERLFYTNLYYGFDNFLWSTN